MRLLRLPRVRLRAAAPAGTARLRDRFELLVPLGSGGFGTVWEGFDMLLERPVAIKEIEFATRKAGAAELALREARATARLNHPGIVSLYEVVQESGRLYLVSELVDGCTLAELIELGTLSDLDVAVIGGALCEALAHAHGMGVVHRDVKPANVIVPREWCEQASAWRPQPAKLMDFGIAAVLGATGAGDHLVAGSAHYVAPEQVSGGQPAAAADVYSLAAVLYECLTGAPPSSSRRRDQLAAKRLDLPPSLTETIDAALDAEPEVRPPLGALADALEGARPKLSDTLGHPSRLRGLTPRLLSAIRTTDDTTLQRVVAAIVLAALGLLLDAALGAGVALPAGAAGAALGAISPRFGPLLMVAGATGALAGAGLGGAAVLIVAAAVPATLAAIRELWSGALAVTATWWLIACGALAGEPLLLALPRDLPPSHSLSHNPEGGFDTLLALATPLALATMAIWAAAAFALRWVAAGSRGSGSTMRLAAWAGAFAVCQLAAAPLLDGELATAATAFSLGALGFAGTVVLTRRYGGRVSGSRRSFVTD